MHVREFVIRVYRILNMMYPSHRAVVAQWLEQLACNELMRVRVLSTVLPFPQIFTVTAQGTTLKSAPCHDWSVGDDGSPGVWALMKKREE